MKEKIKRVFFWCLLVFVLIGTSQIAFAITSGDWEYETYKTGDATVAKLTKYIGSSTSVTVPSTINGYTVKQLVGTFYDNKTITSVTIPNGITKLSDTFYDCTRLKKITLPSSIISYSGAFTGSGIEEITLPKGKYDLSYAFYWCVSLKKVVILGTVTSLAHSFENCFNLTTVSIAGVTNDMWLEETFVNCNLRKIYLPKGISHIDRDSFYGCDLKEIFFAGSSKQWDDSLKYDVSFSSETIIYFNAKSMLRTGLVKNKGKWIYVVNEELSTKTGLVQRAGIRTAVDDENSWFYVEKASCMIQI